MSMTAESREREILESARKFFFRYGFKKTSMEEIAEDAGIAKGSLYNYFRNKEALFRRCAEIKRQEIFQSVSNELLSVRRADEKIVRMCMAVIAHVKQMVRDYAMSDVVLSELMAKGISLMGNHPDHIALTSQILQEGTDSGIFNISEPEKAARVLNLILQGLTPRWFTLDEKGSRTEVSEVFQFIFRGLWK